jgi:tetratricopeptide (TPR) repeat protein
MKTYRKYRLSYRLSSIARLLTLQPFRRIEIFLLCLLIYTPAWSEEEVVADVPSLDPVKEYLDTIDRTEAESSAYSVGLAELYLGLAQSLLEREQLEEAKKAFQQGAQIVRINYGLNSPDQTHYLFSIADIESQLGNLNMADKLIENIYSINVSSFGENHPDLLPVLSQMLTWYEDRHPLLPDRDRYTSMAKIDRIAGKMVWITEQEKGLEHPETAKLYRKIGQLQYFMAEHLSTHTTSSETEFNFDMGGTASDLTETAQEKYIPSHYRRGTDAFNKFAESVGQNPNYSSWQRAEALAQLGDWHLAFNKPQSAGYAYQEAFDVLMESQQSEPLALEYFDQPTPMRFLREEVFSQDDPDDGSETELEVSMTVTRRGTARNLEILNLSENVDKDGVRGIKRKVGNMRFRPRLVEGKPVESDGFIWRYAVEITEG